MSTATTQAEILSDLIDVSNESDHGEVIYVFTHQGRDFSCYTQVHQITGFGIS